MRKFILACICGFFLGANAYADEVKLHYGLTMNMPESGVTDDGEYIGFELDMINALMQGYSTDFEITFRESVAWKRMLEEMEKGEMDFMSTVSYREDRLSFMDYIGVFNTEATYLIVRESVNIGALDTLDDILLPDGKQIVHSKSVQLNPEFDQRIVNDEEYAQRFDFENHTRAQTAAKIDFERIETDDEYRETVESKYGPGVFDAAQLAVVADAELISLGRIGGIFATNPYAQAYIDTQARRLQYEDLGEPLKAIRVDAFGVPVTYLAASLHTPESVRDHIKARYKEMRENGEFDTIWKTWFGELSTPPYVEPGV